MQKRDVLNSPKLTELKKKRRQNLQNKVLLSLLGFVVIFSSLVYISRIEKLNIKEVAISGNEVVDTNLIREVVDENLEGNYLFFLPKTNFLLFPKNKIKNNLFLKFKRLDNISFNLDNSGILSIALSERKGKYIWCGENLPDPLLPIEESLCSFMDSSGYVFDIAPYFSGDVYFKFFGSVEESYYSKEVFEKLAQLQDRISNMGLKPSSVLVKTDGDIELYLSSNILPPDAPKIIFKKDFELEKLSENLQAAITTDPLKSDLKNKYSSLLYIDLRFGNKVYFKFK